MSVTIYPGLLSHDDRSKDYVSWRRAVLAPTRISPEAYDAMRTGHKMTAYFRLVDIRNARLHDKPIVDVSLPINPLDRRHDANVASGCVFTLSPEHIGDAQELSPYTMVHHTSDWVIQAVVIATAFGFNMYTTTMLMSQVQMGNPHTQWAHNIVFSASLLRHGLAAFVAVAGSLYSYEFMYTHVPYLKIRDPSPNGWKAAFEEDQSTYIARTISMIFWPIGNALRKATMARFAFNYGCSMNFGLFYEFVRTKIAAQHHLGAVTANGYSDFAGTHGSLTPDMTRRADPHRETSKALTGNKYDNPRSSLRERIFQSAGWEVVPFKMEGMKALNPIFNWKTPRNTDGLPMYRCKSESWSLPEFNTAAMASAAMDR